MKDKDFRTPLAYAAAKGHHMMVKLLLDQPGINLDTRDTYRRTPLLQAARKGHSSIVEMLLRSGSDPDIKDQSRMTPLFLATRNGHEAVLEEHFKTGEVQPDLMSEKEKILLHLVAENG